MDTSKRRFSRLVIASATAAGVALASPVVADADESEAIESAPIGEVSDSPVEVVPTTEPLVIELVIEGNPATESTDLPSASQPDEPAEAGATPTATELEPIVDEPRPMIGALDAGTGEEHTGGTDGEHSGGGGSGDPYQMTFVVAWRLPDDSTIPVLDDVLPLDWRTMFDLAAASETGGGKPTSAHCTYPPAGTDLVCEFQNPGQHASVTDGMIVPGKKSATYSVTVLWPTSGWTIDGANAGPYSARDLCPRGGPDHESDHESDHEGGHDSGHGETPEALEASDALCIHTVVMRRAPATADPPPDEPPAPDPPVTEIPAAGPPQSPTLVPPEAAPAPPEAETEVLAVRVTPRTLPATGNTATTTLMIGTVILALGGCLSVVARRRNELSPS